MKNRSSFSTFNPSNSLVSQFVSYYYLDIKPDNKRTEFTCFPHYNSSISLYSSHKRTENNEMVFDKNAPSFQIFSPIRTKTMRVKQVGKIHRIVIVLNPLGVQQFYRNLDFTKHILRYNFFSEIEIQQIFCETDPNVIANLLDDFLLKRYKMYQQEIVSKSIACVFTNLTSFSVESLADDLNICRRHLNRTFKTHLGLSIKQFHCIALFRKAMEKKISTPFEVNWTSLAYDLNFSDQSHLNKVFKKFALVSPNEFFKKGTVLGNQGLFWHIHTF
ncbi:helix-turn-helix domain-containing protein [Polluticaenibacter yanchengensis]|uniref:Helix-turn-helix domain-containing protein n=1 Tax=Polluticaenibacter yanchengensis TaxID=3014562 RepID=A0ABT4UG94_9BACT|nr:helix-turn-helix domain-containing protein [Chitinophagaceae bacterium LY-5]